MIRRGAFLLKNYLPKYSSVLKLPITSNFSQPAVSVSSTSFTNYGTVFPGTLPCHNGHNNNVNIIVAHRSFQSFRPSPTCPLVATILNTKFPQLIQESRRTVTHYGMRKGTRKTVKAVIKRFYRLAWGAWIRPRTGRHHHLWRKKPKQRKRLRHHVFCNSTQSRMLDKMVTKFWREKKYYVDDPYESYHKRSSFWITKGL